MPRAGFHIFSRVWRMHILNRVCNKIRQLHDDTELIPISYVEKFLKLQKSSLSAMILALMEATSERIDNIIENLRRLVSYDTA